MQGVWLPRLVFLVATGFGALLFLLIALWLYQARESAWGLYGAFICGGIGLGSLSFALGLSLRWLRELWENHYNS